MTHRYSALDDAAFVSGQLDPRDAAELAGQGFTRLVNHRPDAEEPGQPSHFAVAEAAAAVGISCIHAPIRGLPDADAVAATAQVLAALQPGEKVLMFCRSGMRSSAAWAMTRRREGVDAEGLRARAAAAGYDLSRLPL